MTSLRQLDAAMKAGFFGADHAEKVAALNGTPAPIVVAPAVARVSAIEWYMAILGKYAKVADERQTAHARYLTGDDNLSGLMITPIGASFAELDARLAALATPAVVDVEPVMSDGAMDVAALDSAQMDSVCGGVGSDLAWDGGYPETWNARVLREIDEAEAAIGEAREGAAWIAPHELAAAREAEAMLVEAKIAAVESQADLDAAYDAAWGKGAAAYAHAIGMPFGQDANGTWVTGPVGKIVPARSIAIKGTTYQVEPIAPGEDNLEAVRLVKPDGAIYDLAHTADGLVVCDCADYEFRHVGTAGLCKHGAALVAAGLLDAPTAEASAPAEAESFADALLAAVGPEPLDDAPGMTLAAFVAYQAGHFRVFGNAACDLIADELASFADRIRRSGTRSVNEFETWDRMADLADREALEAAGWRAGFEEAQREDVYA